MNDNTTNRMGSTEDIASADDYRSQGTPTSPLQGPSAGYTSSEARVAGTGQAMPPPPVPPGPFVNQYPPAGYPPQGSAQQWKGRSRRHGGSIVGPVILIGAGIVFLLNNMDVLPWSIWNQVWRLWPIVLIAIGLDLVIGRRNTALSLIIVLLLVGGGVAFLLYNGGFQPMGELATTSLNVPLSGAKSADITLDVGTGNLTLDSSANSESLATGTLEYYQGRNTPQQSVSTVGGQEMLSLSQNDSNGFDLGFLFGGGRSPQWNVHLDPKVPMTFKANLGTGNSAIDLSSSQANVVNIDSGTGNATVDFPANAGQVTSTISGGVGNLNLTIPAGLETRIDVNTGIGNIDVDNRFTKQGDNTYITKGYNDAKNKLTLKLDVGIGNVEVSQ
jgi:hypothetical protein